MNQQRLRRAVEGTSEGVWRAAWQDALRCTSLGWDLALPIVGGVILGHILAVRLHTGVAVTVLLLFVGVAVGYTNVVRRLRRDSQRRERQVPS